MTDENNGRKSDPTELTTEALQREISLLREFLVEHIDSRMLIYDERFNSVQTQFRERDTRQEREARDNKIAVDAAFAAQKESASQQNKSNAEAIGKSEASTKETIDKLSELFKTTTDSITRNLNDLKGSLAIVVEQRDSIRKSTQEQRSNVQPFQVALFSVLGGGIVGLIVWAVTK